MASSEMGRRFARKSRHDVNSAAGKRSGGRKNRKTNSGSSRNFRQFGNQAEHQSADHEQDGIRDVQFAGQQRQNCHGQQQSHKISNPRPSCAPSLRVKVRSGKPSVQSWKWRLAFERNRAGNPSVEPSGKPVSRRFHSGSCSIRFCQYSASVALENQLQVGNHLAETDVTLVRKYQSRRMLARSVASPPQGP